MEDQLKDLITSLRPIMQRDGGDVSLLGYNAETKTASLCFHRANYHCPGANCAMQMLFERKVRACFPEIERVLITEE